MYCVKLTLKDGKVSYLSVKGRTEWKTKRIAQKHARDIQTCIDRGRDMWNTIRAEVQEV